MPFFIVLHDHDGLVGVWTTPDEVAATRWGLELSLTYPGCRTLVRRASDFETLKAQHRNLDFGNHVAQPVGRMRRPSVSRGVSSPAVAESSVDLEVPYGLAS